MVQVIRRTPKEPPRKTKGQEFSETLTSGLNYYANKQAKDKEDEALSDYLGFDVSGLDSDTRKEIVKQTSKGKARNQYFGGDDPLLQNSPQGFANEIGNTPIEVQTGAISPSELAGTSPLQELHDIKKQSENFQYEDEDDYDRPKITKPKQIPKPAPFKAPYSEDQVRKAMGWNVQEGRAYEQANANARRAYDNEVKSISNQNEQILNRFQREKHFNKEYKLKERKQNESEKTERNKIKKEKGNLENALKSVNTMKSIRKNGTLGIGSSVRGILSPKARKDRGKYVTLGNSLISYASAIPVRNKVEFETLTGKINDPSITDAEAQGVLEGLEQVIKDSLMGYDDQEESSRPSNKNAPNVLDFI